jgi:hypothetical protein
MELLVHGTKQGYKSNFIINIQPTFSLGDVRNGANNEDSLGKSFYSLALINGGCVYSKYTILRDTLRSLAIGNIAFSVYVPRNKEIEGNGSSIKTILDRLSKYYIDNYTIENNNNRGELTLINEDWSFIQDVLGDYIEIPHSRKDKEIISGILDPAYHYYKTEEDLISHFNKPYQEEYSSYKQIYFIDFNEINTGNPLQVLKHSGNEVNPDLNTKKYYLNTYNSNNNVKIYAFFNNQWNERNGLNDNNIIKSNWRIRLESHKECHEPIIEEGSILDNSPNVLKHISIDNNNSIRINNDSFQHVPIEVVVSIDIIRKDGGSTEGFKIKVENQPWTSDSEILFKGLDINKEHRIEARIGNNYFGEGKIIPANDNVLKISLIEKRVLVIKVYEEGDKNRTLLKDFEISAIPSNKYSINKNEIIFIDDNINKIFQISVKKNNYINSKPQEYLPSNYIGELEFALKKKENKLPPNGTKSGGKGTGETDEKKSGNFSFSEKLSRLISKPSVISTLVVVGLISIIAYFAYNSYSDNDTSTKDIENIEAYLKGDSLILDTLNKIKANWKSKEKTFIEEPGFFSFLSSGGSDSSEWKLTWKPVNDRIDSAIMIRKFVNEKEFIKLKKNNYSDELGQFQFKKSIENIDEYQNSIIKNQLKDISNLPLSEIASKINDLIINLKQANADNLDDFNNVEDNTNNVTVITEIKQNQESKSLDSDKKRLKNSKQTNNKENREDKNKELLISNSQTALNLIKGSHFSKAKLESFIVDSSIDSDLKKSIKLCLKFWSLDGSIGNSYSSYLADLNKDKNLKNSELKAFVSSICLNKGKKYKYINEIQRKKISDSSSFSNIKNFINE